MFHASLCWTSGHTVHQWQSFCNAGEDEDEIADEEIDAEAKGEDEDAGEAEEPGGPANRTMNMIMK